MEGRSYTSQFSTQVKAKLFIINPHYIILLHTITSKIAIHPVH